jgi:hypothetical protein
VVHRHSERGEGRFGFFVALALFIVAIFLAVKIVPVRIDAYTFRDKLREEARFAAIHRNDKEVKQRLLDEAESLEIPLEPKNLTIRRTRNEVIIKARYDQVVDLKVTKYTYRFRAEQRAPLF